MFTTEPQCEPTNYSCSHCDYSTTRKSQYNRHLLTRKHEMLTNIYNENQKGKTQCNVCKCGKSYKYRQSLSVHRKKCGLINGFSQESQDKTSQDLPCQTSCSKASPVSNDAIYSLITENNDFKKILLDQQKQLLEQQKQIVEQQKQIGELIPKMGNTINNTANIKQKFNINVFLNEYCKDAINMKDFVKSIQVSLEQLDITKNKGLAQGLSNVIIENMNKLSLYERPLHCTDTKRETLYVKDNDSWEKDKSKEKIKKAIKDVSSKQYNALSIWKKENPDFTEVDAKQDYFARTISAIGKNTNTVDEKIIKNICTKTYLKEELKDLDENIIE